MLKYKEYIKKCRLKEFINHEFNINKEYIFLSICLPVYNMEKYIESALLSIINQSFKFFEIVIVNDNSNDDTVNLVKHIQNRDKRIININHSKNLGVYKSRTDAILNANGKYILFMDPDDIIFNQDIFQESYNYYTEFNLDIIEFLVYHQREGRKNIFFPKDHKFSRFHDFKKSIISQPELSDIIFYSSVICRTIWNKLIRKEIIQNSINYLNKDYFSNQFLIAADDTPINILSFHFANNYSNINLPGYLYNLRENGMSRFNKVNINHNIILSYNFLLYFKFFYKYIISSNKDANFFLFEFKAFSFYLLKFKELNANEYITMTVNFYKEIRQKNISETFQSFINESILYFMK